MKLPQRSLRRVSPQSALALGGLLLAACASSPKDRSLTEELGKPYVAPADTDSDMSLGAYLNEISQALTAWSNLVANASTRQDRDKVPLLTARLTDRSNLTHPVSLGRAFLLDLYVIDVSQSYTHERYDAS